MNHKINFKTNTIYCGDNKEVLLSFPNESVDLIYIDPPFYSKQFYLKWDDKGDVQCFEDRFRGGIDDYIEDTIQPCVEQLYRILKKNGTFYIHCDWHADAYIRVFCDKLFDYNNFQCNIIWHYPSGGMRRNCWSSKTDTILMYSKSKDFFFNIDSVRVPYNPKTIERQKHILAGKIRPTNPLGKLPDNVFEIPALRQNAKEREGYPTQKPEALLERLIKASSNEGDVILDAFCGCGTTLAVAHKLKRKFIGIDISEKACIVTAKRIEYDIKNIIKINYTIKELEELDPYKFQRWTIERIGGYCNEKFSRDKGIDGWLYGKKRAPIQVKQSNVGSPVIQQFESVIYEKKPSHGIIIGLSFSNDALKEIRRFNRDNENGYKIVYITADKLLSDDFSIDNINENKSKGKTILDF